VVRSRRQTMGPHHDPIVAAYLAIPNSKGGQTASVARVAARLGKGARKESAGPRPGTMPCSAVAASQTWRAFDGIEVVIEADQPIFAHVRYVSSLDP
jgi:hypothetical protein